MIKYNEMIEISNEYLYKQKKINIMLFILFEKLEVYLDKEYAADKSNYNGIFVKHPKLVTQIETWNKELERRKQDLLEFVLK